MLEMFFAQLAVPTDVLGFISLSQLKPNPGNFSVGLAILENSL